MEIAQETINWFLLQVAKIINWMSMTAIPNTEITNGTVLLIALVILAYYFYRRSKKWKK